MQRNQYIEQFVGLSPEGQSYMLLALGMEMTLAARDVYGPSAYRTPIKLSAPGTKTEGVVHSDQTKLIFASGLAELNHRIFGHLLSPEGTEKRYPADVLVDILCDIAEAHGLQAGFPLWWQRARDRTG